MPQFIYKNFQEEIVIRIFCGICFISQGLWDKLY